MEGSERDENERGAAKGRKLRRVKPGKPEAHKHTHPGGTGSVLGTHLAKFSSFQGLSLLFTNLLHYSSIAVVARLLGPKALGSYALLFFLTGAISQTIHLLTKPGTMMRTFGISDDDSDDIEEDPDKEGDDVGSARPTFTLGVGLAWTFFLAIVSFVLMAIFRTPIASFLLHDSSQGDVVMLASITGGAWAIFKLTEMVVWFEGRALTFALLDAARPAFNLAALVALVSAGAGVKGAIMGQTIGTSAATALSIVLIWSSFRRVFSFAELKEILKRGMIRIPIATSMWAVQNSDSFILSRFLDHKSIGLYNLASRTGFMVAFLPQGFRIALRPVRKTAAYEAFRREYGLAVANGQMLAYFYLITLTAILAMVLGGEILITVGGPKFASVAPLVPLTAGAMSMPALFRTVAMSANYPHKRKVFVTAAVFVGIAYIGLCILLLGHTGFGIYAPPVAMLGAFLVPTSFMFVSSQLGKRPVKFPYLAMIQATLVAVGIAAAYHYAHPANKWIQLPTIAVVMLVWFALLFVLRIIPRHHWHPLRHIVRSALRKGSALQFNKRDGVRSLKPRERKALHAAIVDRLPDATLVPATVHGGETDGDSDGAALFRDDEAEGARLVRLLRRAGNGGGIPIADAGELDAGISLFLFSNQPVAVRLRKMRQLMLLGVDPHELRTLEDLRNDLAVSPRAWDGDAGRGKQPRTGNGGDGRSGRAERPHGAKRGGGDAKGVGAKPA